MTIVQFIDELPGNKFYVGALCGFCEVFAMILSGFLMRHMGEMKVFYLLYGFGVTGYVILIASYPSEGLHSYIAVCLVIIELAGWYNLIFGLITELRVPPEAKGAIMTLVKTISTTCAFPAPSMAQLPPPLPYFLLFGVAFAGFITALTLPLPC